MRIGHIASGISNSVHLDMSRALRRAGHDVCVFTEERYATSARAFTRTDVDGVQIWAIHHERRNPWLLLPDRVLKSALGALVGRRFFTVLHALRRFMARTRCDIYIAEGDWFAMCLSLLRAVSRFRWVYCVHDHEYLGVRFGYAGEPSSRVREAIKRWTLRKADAVRANSHVTQDVLVRAGIDPDRIWVVPLHCTPRMFVDSAIADYRASARREVGARHGLPVECEIVLASCRLTPFKGLELAVRALAGVRQIRPNVKLLICGDDRRVPGLGSYRQFLTRVADEAGVADAVVFVGGVDVATVRDYYAAAAVHVAPSYVDTFNYSAVEAALTGTRNVLTDGVGCGRWLAQCGAATVVPGRDVDAFRHALAESLAARGCSPSMDEQVSCVAAALAPDTIAVELITLLEQHASARAAAPSMQ